MILTNPGELTVEILKKWHGDPAETIGESRGDAALTAAGTSPPPAAAKTGAARAASPSRMPPAELVQRVIEVAYEASLLEDEGRPVTLRLLLESAKDLDAEQGPPEGLLRLIFTEPRPFTASELRRISPASSYHRSLVGVHLAAHGGLEVWGVVQSGPRWLQKTQGGRGAAPKFPDCLIVAVTRPGCLDICRGERVLASVRAGRTTPPGFDVFDSLWLSRHFSSIREELRVLHNAARESQSAAWRPLDRDLTRLIGQQMIKRLVSTIRASRHGGALVLTPCEYDFGCVHGAHLKFKYRFVDDASSRRYRRLIVSLMNALAALGSELKMPPQEPVGWRHFDDINHPLLATLEEGIFEIAHLIAQLASVDGAIALTKRFELLGFGVEIGGALPEVRTVRRALDIEGDHYTEESVEDVGTRHRSAYRLCSAVHDAIAIVVSQDGTVSFVGRKDGSVYYWPHEINSPMIL